MGLVQGRIREEGPLQDRLQASRPRRDWPSGIDTGMNLSELEVIASELIEREKRLDQIDSELEFVEGELKQQPKQTERGKKIYWLIGIGWSNSGELTHRRP